jgi:UDP-N-acetylglucosamine 2-epimerase (non-hydrolysing)
MGNLRRIAVVQGTRPEIIKNYSFVKALRARRIPYVVLHTNQHAADVMCGDVYAEMDYAPDHRLPGDYRIGSAIDWLQQRFRDDGVTHVVVNGDTAASLAGAVAALYAGLPLVHIEAGLRSRDVFMLEERNRIMVDAVAELLFAYTEHEIRLLERSPEVRGQVQCEGNTTVDLIHDFGPRLERSPGGPEAYLFATMHRREFTESPERMRLVFGLFGEIARTLCPLVLALHPRTRDAMHRHGIPLAMLEPARVVEPLPALAALAMQRHAAAVLTDSGCMQEEAYILGTPCITVRENTERHLTVQHGGNVVTGFSHRSILAAVRRALDDGRRPLPDIYGAPGAGERMLARIVEHFA